MPSRSSKPKRDFSQVAFDVVAKLTREKPTRAVAPEISEALDDATLRKQVMREMGRRGGKKGGKARAEKLTELERKNIAKNAAERRWSKEP